ncbi:hypothetical protein LBMAG32_00710 [Nitrosomonadaceae bacterium]|nr:hypothetical protein LBMAG32_00710 [Nitrosomonadaceae bacterium]
MGNMDFWSLTMSEIKLTGEREASFSPLFVLGEDVEVIGLISYSSMRIDNLSSNRAGYVLY